MFPLATLSLAGNHKSASLQVDHPPSPHRNSSRREKQTLWKVPFSRVIRVSIFCLLFLSLPISGWHPRVRLPPGRPPPSLQSRAEGKSTLLEARAYLMPYLREIRGKLLRTPTSPPPSRSTTPYPLHSLQAEGKSRRFIQARALFYLMPYLRAN